MPLVIQFDNNHIFYSFEQFLEVGLYFLSLKGNKCIEMLTTKYLMRFKYLNHLIVQVNRFLFDRDVNSLNDIRGESSIFRDPLQIIIFLKRRSKKKKKSVIKLSSSLLSSSSPWQEGRYEGGWCRERRGRGGRAEGRSRSGPGAPGGPHEPVQGHAAGERGKTLQSNAIL